jgi:glutathione S-transferase
MTNEIILHHYPLSPFGEKIRRILAFKNLSWRSVFIPMVMPKPDVTALTGGHRRTPVLQIGADIYCDTSLIADVLEHIAPTPTIYPEACKGTTRIISQWADTLLFPVAMAYNFQPKGAEHVFASMGEEAAKAFAQDRSAMRGGQARMSLPEATVTYKSYLRRLASMLEHALYLCGNEPSVADFSAYHPIWFTARNVPHLSHILDHTPAIRSWYERLTAFGQANEKPTQLSSAEAIRISMKSTPKPLLEEVFEDVHSLPLGSRVIIQAESFGIEPSEGELLAATKTRFTIKRSDPRAGTVHVHFPRNGFVLKAAQV